MKYLLLIALQFCCEIAFCQMDTTGLPGNLYDSYRSGYNYVSRHHRNKLIAKFIYEDSSKRLREEYFLRDDSSYYFIEFNSRGSEIQNGIIKLSPKRLAYDTVQIPDWKKDPKGENGFLKDSLVPKYIFVKNGFWTVDSNGRISKGNYFENQKTGVWIQGKNVAFSHEPPFRYVVFESRQYRNGVMLERNTAYSNLDSIWRFLNGKWLWHGMASDFYNSWHFTKSEDSLSNYNFDFIDKARFSESWEIFDGCSDWHYASGILYICSGKKQKRFQLLYLDDQVMYWRPLDHD